ncbi:hypothetical protein BTO30_12490 [Domibacillus antri]|uniref:Uncharacterized protein n=1 Tax=Domibacillus antri TaxID=1714264 RepID=A0A1Q8Q3J0_9BACI|nr:hypothetical protein [Domibacillus antri]OLN21910.1 hypothetical protein BTO30_12490 [Domibacillus antri]
MQIYKLFNSAPGDPRTYQAADFASYFGDVLSTGLLHTDNIPALQVKCEGTDLRTYVEPGKALMQGYAYENTANEYLTHALPEATLDRIDRIVLRLDKTNANRYIKLFIKQGLAAEAPVPTALQRDAFIYELSLAQIRVRANTSVLDPADLIDERLDEQLCGLVYSLISIPTSQFQQEWDEFMAGIEASGFTPVPDFNAHVADYVKHPGFGVTAGTTANTYELNLNPAPTAYVDGMSVSVAIHADSTGASTLNVNGLGAIPLKKANGNDVTNLKLNGVYTFRYIAATGNFILQGEGGSGNAVAADLLSGKTASTDTGDIVGTMTNRGVVNITPNTVNQVIPAGFHNGSGIVAGDPDLIAENIKLGTVIFGVTGNVPPIFLAGDAVLYLDSGQYSNTTTTPTKVGKAFRPTAAGTIRVSLELRASNVNNPVAAQVYKNGSPTGTTFTYNPSSTSAWVKFTQDIIFSANDVLEIYIWCIGSLQVDVRNIQWQINPRSTFS